MTIRMYPFTCGSYVIDRGGLNNRSWGEAYEHPLPMFAFRHPKGVAVFDTGHNHRGLADPLGWFGPSIKGFKEIRVREEDCLPAQLKRVGIDPDEVTHVILSHLHIDHAGEVASFPKAQFFIRGSELPFAWWSTPNQRGVYVVRDMLDMRDFNIYEIPDGIDFDVFEDGSLVCIHTPGHTPGHQSLIVTLPDYDRPMVICGDACCGRDNLEGALASAGVMWEVAQWYASIQKLRRLEAMGHEMWFGHDMKNWLERMKEWK